MLTEMIKKKTKNSRSICPYPKAVNLYRFIRLVLGKEISNRQIALRWGIHEKNFHEFLNGRYPVPSLERLEQLALALRLNKYLVFCVAGGASADKVFRLIKKNDLPACRALLGVGRPGQMKLLFGKL